MDTTKKYARCLPVSCLEKNAYTIIGNISLYCPLFIEIGGNIKAVLLDIKEYEDELKSIIKLRLMLKDLLNR